MKTATASTHFKIWCNCPYCDNYIELQEEHEIWRALDGQLYADDCDVEIRCNNEDCEKTFMINSIE